MPPDESRAPSPDAPRENAPRENAPREDAATDRSAESRPDAALPPLPPFHTPSHAERPLPRGCHPLVFGVVMATLQMGALFYFMPSCFGRPG